MEISKKIIIGLMIIAIFIFLVSITVAYVQTHIAEFGYCPYEPVLIPAFASLGLFIGSLTYYFMFIKLEKSSEEKRLEIVNSSLEMLQVDEKEVIKKIIENKGEILQSKLSALFGKVKTFRVLEGLSRRGIIVKESYGKTNKIKLNEKFKEVLCKD